MSYAMLKAEIDQLGATLKDAELRYDFHRWHLTRAAMRARASASGADTDAKRAAYDAAKRAETAVHDRKYQAQAAFDDKRSELFAWLLANPADLDTFLQG